MPILTDREGSRSQTEVKKGIMNKKTAIILICAVAAALAAGIAIGVHLNGRTGGRTTGDEKDVIELTGDDVSGDDPISASEDHKEQDPTGADGEDKAESGEGGTTEDGLILNCASNNSWQDGDITMYGMDWQIVNGSAETIDGWELEIGIEGLARAEGWNGAFSIKDDKLTIKNADYNGSIAAGGVTEGIGCNLGVKGTELNVTYAKLNGADCKVNMLKSIDRNAGRDDRNTGKQNTGNDNSASDTAGEGSKTDVTLLLKRDKRAVQGDDWLHTDGRRILDKDGREVWLTGLNWFGYNTGTNTFDGLSNSEFKPIVESIADRGFNLIRVPMSAQLLNEWASGEYPQANYNHAYNEELNAMNSLEIFDYFLTLAEANGIKVMIDIHSAETDPSGHMTNLWYTDKVSEKDYLEALKWAALRYKDNDTIIAFDLKNEPHGKPSEGSRAAVWNDSDSPNNWKKEAEKAALTVLKENPNVLIMVEGIETYPMDIKENGDYRSKIADDYYISWWGGNLRGVADYPIDLGKFQDKLVYSPHDYGPTVYNQPWFYEGYDYDSLMKECWRDNWFYIYEDKTAPILIGEWGGFMREPNLKWMTALRQLIGKYRLNHTFWCLNPNSGDTGGLLLDDYKTWDEDKYSFVKEVLWQEDGKFMGLDHEIQLGK
ncbi:MAG: cellulase family glycosylhydrolase [Lachnospiraceae bacterium]|nr:cellulase family glycosylhydrolase [Lachnospiraceae bacterium]